MELRLSANPTPSEQLLVELVRLRRNGFAFDIAWKRALRNIKWPEKKEPRRQWKEVIESQRIYWERCYRREGVAVNIGEIIEALSLGIDLTEEALA